jgi:hypothetical protein
VWGVYPIAKARLKVQNEREKLNVNSTQKEKPRMKNIFLLTALRTCAKRTPLGLGFALAATLLHANATAQEVNLGTANNFAVLAASAITSTGNTIINGGNVGLSPNTLSSVTGFPPATIASPYTTDFGNAVALAAQNDLATAYNTAAGFAHTLPENLTGQNLGGLTLTPGVYFFASSALLTGTLTLNDQGNPDAKFVFQIGSALTTASDSSVVTINGPTGGAIPGISVFWQIGSSATLGTGSDFEGNILAKASITADTGATIDGRLLAETGAVTLDDNTITAPPAEVAGGGGGGTGSVPDTNSTLFQFGCALATLFACGKRIWRLPR